MKLKRVLLIILLVLIAIIMLQANVNADEVDYSEYDYLLTQGGVIAKVDLIGTEELIAGIKGVYTGEIKADNINKKLTINNFSAKALRVFNEEYEIWVEGLNAVQDIDFLNGDYGTWVNGNGTITTTSWINSTFCGEGEGSYSEETEEYTCTYYIGNSINSSVNQIRMKLSAHDFDASLKISDSVAQKICNYLKLDGDIYYYLEVPGDLVIPSSIFAALKESNKRLAISNSIDCVTYYFNGSNISNPNADFKLGLSEANSPIGGMTNVNVEGAKYVSFNNTESFPGKVQITFIQGGYGDDGDIEMIYLYIYSYDENTKLYKYEGFCEDPFKVYDFETDYPIGKYVLTHTIISDDIVSGENAKEENKEQNQTQTGGEINKEENKETERNEQKEEEKQEEIKKEDTTKAPGTIPHAGGTTFIILLMLVLAGAGVLGYVKNKDLKGI